MTAVGVVKGTQLIHVSCASVSLSHRYTVNEKYSDISEVLCHNFLLFYKRSLLKLLLLSYHASLFLSILVVKEQHCRSKEILWVCSLSYLRGFCWRTPEEYLFCTTDLLYFSSKEKKQRWHKVAFAFQERNTNSTDMRVLTIFASLLFIFPWPAP